MAQVASKRLCIYLTDDEWVSLLLVSEHDKQSVHDWVKEAALGVCKIAADADGIKILMEAR